ncbi:MAG: radical SAM protein [Kiritimatiellae bacterium]|nr:radical SAM protein [Kiritimatiellia bacterium]MDD5522685.1 radical SAM protein [Kiritimatiellia bacterium]
MNVLFVWPNKDDGFHLSLSISLLSALLKRDGHKTACFDTCFIDFGFSTPSDSQTSASIFKPVDMSAFDTKKRKVDVQKVFTEKLNSFKPDIIAVSVVSDVIEIGRQLSDIAKAWDKRVTVIWGGKGATLEVERILSFPTVDYVCRGEGIVAFPLFVNAIQSGTSPYDIGNLCYRQGSTFVMNDLYPRYDDYDSLPFIDWSLFDERSFCRPYDGKVLRGGDHMISCGCPNNCTYCINDFYHDLYGNSDMKRYSPARFVKEIKELTRTYNLGFYKFHDEDFLMKPTPYFEELAELYSAEVGVPFCCMTNPKSVTAPKVALLKKMGCVSASLGIETGDMELRKKILQRRDSRDDIIRAFKLLKGAHIRTNSYNMLGIPFETRNTYMATILLNREADVQIPQAFFFFPFKGTKLREIAIKHGFFSADDNRICDPARPALHFKDLSESELIAMWKRFTLYVKFPEVLWPFIKRSEQMDDIGRALEERLNEIFRECVMEHDGWFNHNGKLDSYISQLTTLSASKGGL